MIRWLRSKYLEKNERKGSKHFPTSRENIDQKNFHFSCHPSAKAFAQAIEASDGGRVTGHDAAIFVQKEVVIMSKFPVTERWNGMYDYF
jgi:hypothetical protein